MKKMLPMALLFMMSIIQFSSCESNNLITLLQKSAKTLQVDYPSNYPLYLTNLNAGSTMKMNSIPKTDLYKLEKELPPEAYQKFKLIAYAQEVSFTSFIVEINSNSSGGSMKQYICTGVRDGEYLRYAYIDTFASANLIPQYSRVQEKNCRRWFIFWKKCDTYWKSYLRGYTFDEIEIIKKALRAHAYVSLKAKTEKLYLDTQFVLDSSNDVTSFSGNNKLILNPLNGQLLIQQNNVNGEQMLIKKTFDPKDGPFSFQLKNNGNVKIQGNNPAKKIWQTGTAFEGVPPYKLVLTEEPTLMLVDANWRPLWDALGTYKTMELALIENNMFYSPKAKYFAVLQKDGNFVLYENGNLHGKDEHVPLWCTGITDGSQGPYTLIITKQGNMQLIGKNKVVYWESFTTDKGIAPFRLAVTDSGLLKLMDARDVAIWNSKKAPLKST